ncbi:17496_t:CDS:10, partial [Acaulospora morrowiae]
MFYSSLRHKLKTSIQNSRLPHKCTIRVPYRTTHNLYQGKWEAIIGLEIHAQISSRTKLFSSSSTSFNEPVNTNISVIDAAFPGTIPRLNSKCVDLAVATSLVLSGDVQLISSFDRKQYFYPDLPAGYQITQHYAPLSIGGKLILTHLDDDDVDHEIEVRIKQIQLEQDTGKSIHDVRPGMALIDLNRAGVGLMEIVTEPDIRTPKEAGLTLRKLQSILRAVGSSDGNMEEGSLRCDANVSIHEPGTPFGTRCEIKNLNSVKFLMGAIDAEIERQANELRNGNRVIQETRGYNVAENKTFRLRTKETAIDYRYMPEPDLPPLIITKAYERKIRLMKNYKISLQDVKTLMGEDGGVEYYEEVAKNHNPLLASNWITHELYGLLHSKNIKFSKNPVSTAQLGSIIECIRIGDISGKIGKLVLGQMVSGDKRLAPEIIEEKDWKQITDVNALEAICKEILSQNPEN